VAIPAIQDGEAAEARHRRTGLDNYGSTLPVRRRAVGSLSVKSGAFLSAGERRSIRCGEDIKGKRLMAVPWTAVCIRCQEETETERASLLRVLAEIGESETVA